MVASRFLGSVLAVRGIALASGATPATAMPWVISTSTDGVSFATVFSDDEVWPNAVVEKSFDFGFTKPARYVRFSVASAGSWVGIYEAGVFVCSP